MPQPQTRPVKLGEHDYVVFPQKIGYLMHKLGPQLQTILEAEIEGLDGIDMVAAKTHEVLRIFIPDMMPLHEFLGYASAEALEAGDYDENLDRSPEPLQVKAAFVAASDVNGGEVFKHLKALLGPVLTQRVAAAITAAVASRTPSLTSPTPESSPTSPPTSGESAQTSSGTAPPTSVPSAA